MPSSTPKHRPDGSPGGAGGAPRATAGGVVSTSLSICRRHAVMLAAVGIVLFTPLVLLEAFASQAASRGLAAGGNLRSLAIGGYLGISLLMLGSAMCAGLLDSLLGHEFGHEQVGVSAALRRMPYGRLVAVDLAQSVLVGTGAILGVIPGLIVFTLTCLAGSVVMIERRRWWAAMRRSTALTRHRFWLTVAVITLPVVVEHQVLHALEALLDLPFLALWAVHAVAAVVVLVPVVVTEITLTHHLRSDEQGAADDHPAAGGDG